MQNKIFYSSVTHFENCVHNIVICKTFGVVKFWIFKLAALCSFCDSVKVVLRFEGKPVFEGNRGSK